MNLAELGKWLLLGAAGLAVLGVVLIMAGRLGLGRLPGDITWSSGNTRVYFPLATSIIVSVVLTVLLSLFSRFMR